jgi:hypothetical protein
VLYFVSFFEVEVLQAGLPGTLKGALSALNKKREEGTHMRTDIPVPTEQVYQEEFETESEPSRDSIALNDEEGRSFEVDLEDQVSNLPNEDVPHPRRRGPDRDPDSTLHRHITHCTICNHPDRDAIEECILHWHSPTAIADEFDLGDRRVVWRHARAFGLSQLRAAQARHALGFLIEQAQGVVPSADAIIRAIRALSCIDDQGQWHEPRKEVIITHRYVALQARQEEDAAAADSPDGPTRRRRRPRRPQPTQSRPTDSVAGRFLRSVAGVFSSPVTNHQSPPASFLGTRAEKSSA